VGMTGRARWASASARQQAFWVGRGASVAGRVPCPGLGNGRGAQGMGRGGTHGARGGADGSRVLWRCARGARREARGGARFIRMRFVRKRTVSMACVAMLEFDWIIETARERKGFSGLCLGRETYQIIRRYDAPCQKRIAEIEREF